MTRTGSSRSRSRTGADPQLLLRRLMEAGAPIQRFELVRPSLHQIFLQKVGASAIEARDDGVSVTGLASRDSESGLGTVGTRSRDSESGLGVGTQSPRESLGIRLTPTAPAACSPAPTGPGRVRPRSSSRPRA